MIPHPPLLERIKKNTICFTQSILYDLHIHNSNIKPREEDHLFANWSFYAGVLLLVHYLVGMLPPYDGRNCFSASMIHVLPSNL